MTISGLYSGFNSEIEAKIRHWFDRNSKITIEQEINCADHLKQ